jgi:DNA-binding PucR family transcriptional regulator
MVASSAWVFEYIDRICNQLVIEYTSAHDQWVRTPEAIRTETVRGILSGAIRDERVAGQLLGYEMRRRHHIGLVMWMSPTNGADARTLDRAAHVAAEALGMNDPLVVALGGSEVWAWCSRLGRPELSPHETLKTIDQAIGVRLAAGRVRIGMDGFRASHVEASSAARVAVLAGERATTVTMYDDVELVSLLSADLERARAFVSDELQGMAGSEPQTARLRETMLVLLEEGMSNSRAAQRLYVHHNTVVYRTARAQELLGRRIADRRIQLTAALMLAQTLGNAVLGHEPD